MQLGIVTAIGSLFALVSQPIAGRLSDATTSRFGMRRPWIIAGVVGTFLSFISSASRRTCGSCSSAGAARSFFSNFAQAAEAATLADQVPEHRRGFVSGLVGAATPVAILAGAISLNAFPNDFLRAVIPATVGLVLGLLFAFVLKDKVRTERRNEKLSVLGVLRTFWFNPKKHPDLGWAWLTKAMIMFGYGSVAAYLTLFLATSYGMSIPEQLSFNLTATHGVDRLPHHRQHRRRQALRQARPSPRLRLRSAASCSRSASSCSASRTHSATTPASSSSSSPRHSWASAPASSSRSTRRCASTSSPTRKTPPRTSACSTSPTRCPR